MGAQKHSVPLRAAESNVVSPANPRRILDNRIEHRLKIRRRAADDSQDLARRRLLLQRFAQFALRSCSSLNSRTFSMAMTA